MLKETQRLTLDTCLLQRCCKTVKQNDSATRCLLLTLTADGVPLDLSQAQVFLYCKKPDGTVVFSAAEITNAAEGTVQVQLTTQMLAVPGELCMEIRIYAPEGRLLSTLPFFLMVMEALCTENAVESTNEFSALTQAITKVGDFAAIAARADTAAQEASAGAAQALQAAAKAEQAAGGFVPDASITMEKLADAKANLFNKDTITRGIVAQDGTITPDDRYICTDYIPVQPGSAYTFPKGYQRQFAYYDAQKDFLRWIDGGSSGVWPATLTIPMDIPAAFLRISYLDNELFDCETAMICVGSQYYETYVPYGNVYLDWLTPTIPTGSIGPRQLEDGCISTEKINGAKINLFDKTAITNGHVAQDGAIVLEENYLCTDYIPVRPGSVYTFPAGRRRHFAYYDAQKNFLRWVDGGTSYVYNATVTVPTDIPAAYLRISYFTEGTDVNPDTFMVCIGGQYYETYVPYGAAYVDWLSARIMDGGVTEKELADGSVSAGKLYGAMRNLLDLDAFRFGTLEPDGSIVPGQDSVVSGWIPVTPGTTYALPPKYGLTACFYEENQAFLSAAADNPAVAPANAAFLRISCPLTSFSAWDLMVCEGSVYPEAYVPYGGTYVPWLDRNPLAGKKLGVLGDSICGMHKCYANTAARQNRMAFVRSGNNDGDSDNQSIWGSPIARHTLSGQPLSFVERFLSLTGTGGAWENKAFDFLLIHGGTNDARLSLPLGAVTPPQDFSGPLEESTFCGALERIFRTAQVKYPGCILMFATTYQIQALPNLGEYMEAARQICAKYSVPVLDFYRSSGLNMALPEIYAAYWSDELHLNALGHLRLARQAEAFLRGCGAVSGAPAQSSGAAAEIYGVRFSGSANTGAAVTRLYQAHGLTAGVGTDTQTAKNDFDQIYPWSARRRCCGYFAENGSFMVNAYEGEPGYAADGSNGEVWVEHSLFYFKHTHTGGTEEILISALPLGGYAPAPIFVKPDGSLRRKAYTAAYPLAMVDGKATSRSGVFPDVCSLNSAVEAARTLGENYTVTTFAERYTECLYMWVEFATRNLQSVMMGAASLPYTAADTAAITEDGANRIIVPNAVAEKYVVGQTVLIGSSLGSSNKANNRVVTAITDYDTGNKAIAFDGNPVDVAAGNILCSSAYKNGTCDHVLSSSGSPVSNTSGKYNCVYRGKEAPYGNAFEWVSDLLFQREGAGTAQAPYTYSVYYLPEPARYSSGAITGDYVKLNYHLPDTDGYVQALGLDSRYPFVRLPSQIGASTSTDYSDYYFYPRADISAAGFGGNWNGGLGSGPCYLHCNYAPHGFHISRRARLSHPY